jgi:hypothetical protein
MNIPQRINARLRNLATRNDALLEIGEWAKNTCVLFGTSPQTAYRIAAYFVEGIAREVTAEPMDSGGEARRVIE